MVSINTRNVFSRVEVRIEYATWSRAGYLLGVDFLCGIRDNLDAAFIQNVELGLPGFLVGLELQDILIAVEQPHIATDAHALEACDLIDAFHTEEPRFSDFRDLYLVRDPVIEILELFLKEKGAALLLGGILRPWGEDKLIASVDPFNVAGTDAFETADDVAVAFSKLYHETSLFLPVVQGLFCCCRQIVL